MTLSWRCTVRHRLRLCCLTILVVLARHQPATAFHAPTYRGSLTQGHRSLHRASLRMSQTSLDPLADPLGPAPKATVPTRKKNLKSFTRWLEVEAWKRADLRGLEPVLQAVASASKQINRIVQRAQTDDIYGVAVDSEGKPLDDNVQGEAQQKLDVLCNTIMLRAFCGSSTAIHSIGSEEEDEVRCCADVMVGFVQVCFHLFACFVCSPSLQRRSIE